MTNNQRILNLAVAAALAGWTAGSYSAGFALIEQNGSGLGNAYAGQGAVAEDASTIFFNPAGMSRLPGKNFVFAGNFIKPSATFNNTASTPAVSTIAGTGAYSLGGNGGDAGDLAFIPNLYLSWQLDPRWHVGLGVNAPFGLKTNYDADWIGRFHALKSEIKAINVNPSVSFKINDSIAVGAGLDWQHVQADLTKAVNYSFIASAGGIPGVAANTSGTNDITGNDSAWGFNLGVLFSPLANTDIGLTYRSAISYKLSGNVSYQGRTALLNSVLGGAFGAAAAAAAGQQIGDSGVTADLKLPASSSVAVKHRLNSQWDLLADATWTQWSSLQALNIVSSNGVLLESQPFNWRDTWRFGGGGNYRPNEQWTVRMGVAYDQTPTNDVYRTPRVPDQDRTWVSFGGQYKVSKEGRIDFAYAHIWVKNASVNLNGPPALTAAQAAGRGQLIGTFDDKIDIVSVQYTHSF